MNREIEQRTSSSIITEASRVIQSISADEQYRYILRQREKAEHDEISALRYAKLEGISEGREEGRKEGREKGREEGMSVMAENMRLLGIPEDIIAKAIENSKRDNK